MRIAKQGRGIFKSLSARRAWIEIVEEVQTDEEQTVALRKESVDRNSIKLASSRACTTSLSARRAWIEIVITAMTSQISVSLSARRAWIEMDVVAKTGLFTSSLSARRAWIEIFGGACGKLLALVALRKESVDRNAAGSWRLAMNLLSLSARRAWIEIDSPD